jgi:hypothetical protein
VPEPNTGFVGVGAGKYHSLGIKEDGSVVGWGRNDRGQCDVPEPNTGFIAVAGAEDYSIGLKQPPVGDLNTDYRVEFYDFSIFGGQWKASGCGEPNWCGGADIDKSTAVDGLDLRDLGNHWLEEF